MTEPSRNVPADPRPPESTPESASSARGWRARLVLMCIALFGGLAAWGGVQTLADHFKLPPEVGAKVPQMQYDLEIRAEVEAANRIVDRWNNSLVFGAFGMAAAGFLGLGSGLVLRSFRRTLINTLVGLTLGFALGAAAGLLGTLLAEQLARSRLDAAYQGMLVHGTAWVGVAVAAALAAGRLAPVSSRILAAVAAGLIAAALYPLLAPILFPASPSERIIPGGAGNRLLWAMLVTGLIGFALARTIKRGSEPRAAPAREAR